MEGKTVVITGSTGGIGFYNAQEIARLAAYVIIIGRDEIHVDAAVETLKQETGNAMIERIVGDVFTLQGVQDLATTIGQRAAEMDLLINNSGYIGNTLVHNADGIEMHFAVTSGQYQGSRPFGSGFLLPHCHYHGPHEDDTYPDEGISGCLSAPSPQCPFSCDSTASSDHSPFGSDMYTF